VKRYIDKYGLYNVEPVDQDGLPTGNDGWILTAYAKKLGVEVSLIELANTYSSLPLMYVQGVACYPAARLPEKSEPPVSRDVMLGLSYLFNPAYIDDRFAPKITEWNFSPVELPKFNLLKTIASFILAQGEHRNFLWKKGLVHAYRFMFSVPLTDRAFYYRCRGKNNSSALIRWLKYDQWPGLETFIGYFGEDHPITKAAALNFVNGRLDEL
jgi:hypothetical protein